MQPPAVAMVSVARKNLFHERGRLIISIAGVGFAIVLILILAGLYDGFQNAARIYVEESGADLFVTQEGTTDMFHSFSILPLNLTASLQGMAGVAEVNPLISRQVEIHLENSHAKAAVIGYGNLGGPWQIVRGSGRVGPGEMIVDKALAAKDGLDVGSTVRVGAKDFRIVGISGGTNFFILQYAFIRFDDASGLVLPAGTTTFFLVRLLPNASAADVAERIRAERPDVLVYTNAAFSESNAKLVTESFGPILSVLYAVGGFVGITVIGLTIYTATIEKSKEYGVLKAVGATNRGLFRILLSQALFLSLFGLLMGFGMTALLVMVLDVAVPSLNFYFAATAFILVSAAALGMGAAASAVPMRRLVRIDPAAIFRRG